jgi:hypothetical protein
MEFVVDGHANALLALTHAEGAAQLYLFSEIMFRDQILQLLDHLARTLDVAGATDTNCNFQHAILPHNIDFVLGSGGGSLIGRSPPLYGYDLVITDNRQH